MKPKFSKEEREQRILDTMKYAGKDRCEAEFMVAMELGEIPGDVMTDEDIDRLERLERLEELENSKSQEPG